MYVLCTYVMRCNTYLCLDPYVFTVIFICVQMGIDVSHQNHWANSFVEYAESV